MHRVMTADLRAIRAVALNKSAPRPGVALNGRSVRAAIMAKMMIVVVLDGSSLQKHVHPVNALHGAL